MRRIKELLPILDNLERALEADGDVKEGVEATHEQLEVGLHGLLGEALVGGVLAQVVEGDRQALVDEALGHGDRVGGGLPGDEAAYDVPADRGGRDQLTDHVVAGRGQDEAT